MLFLIDNYDSLTCNIVQYFAELGQNAEARRNDDITSEVIVALKPRYLVIGLGPYAPKETGIPIVAIQHFTGKLSVVGVYFGHQAIGRVLGGGAAYAQTLMHGKVSPVFRHGRGIFKNPPDPVTCTRYHSLVIGHATLPECFEIASWMEDNEAMGVGHKNYAIESIQFRSEVLLTRHGHDMLHSFSEEFRDFKAA